MWTLLNYRFELQPSSRVCPKSYKVHGTLSRRSILHGQPQPPIIWPATEIYPLYIETQWVLTIRNFRIGQSRPPPKVIIKILLFDYFKIFTCIQSTAFDLHRWDLSLGNCISVIPGPLCLEKYASFGIMFSMLFRMFVVGLSIAFACLMAAPGQIWPRSCTHKHC